MEKREIDISAQVVNERGERFLISVMDEHSRQFRVNSAAPLKNILPELVQKIMPEGVQHPGSDECKYLIARQLTSAELTMDEAVDAAGLRMENGDYLLVIIPFSPSTGITLQILDAHNRPLKNFDQNRVLVGRWDPDANINPDLDLTHLLSEERQTKISRRQVYFERQENQWFVILHPEVRTEVFLDSQVLQKNRYYPIQDGVSIGFGGRATNPEVRIVCRLVNI